MARKALKRNVKYLEQEGYCDNGSLMMKGLFERIVGEVKVIQLRLNERPRCVD